MKKTLSLAEILVLSLSFIVLVIAIVTVVTLSRGRSFSGHKSDLIGTWERDMSVSGTPLAGVKEVWRFGSDGSFMNTWECEPGHYRSYEYPKIFARGSYSVIGNKIVLKYSGVKEKMTYSISNSNTTLKIGQDASGYKTFIRK
jgi:hypothetical protein